MAPNPTKTMKWATAHGSGIYNLTSANVEVTDTLPLGVFYLRYNPNNGEFFLEQTADFTLPEKLYGDPQSRVDRMLKSYRENTSNMGVLLTGLKGTGKSLTARKLAIESGKTVIIIDIDYTHKDGFASCLMNINQEVVFFFDEFEKKFGKNEGQARLLSLVEGISDNKSLFIYTANVTSNINEYFFDRPGRIRYVWMYEGLDMDLICDVVDDMLTETQFKDDLIEVFSLIDNGNMNYDRVIQFIKEVNIHKMNPKKLISGFNLSKEAEKDYKLTIKFGENVIVEKLDATASFINFDGSILIDGRMNRLFYDFLEGNLPEVWDQYPGWDKLDFCYGRMTEYNVPREEKEKWENEIDRQVENDEMGHWHGRQLKSSEFRRGCGCNWLENMRPSTINKDIIIFKVPVLDSKIVTFEFTPYKYTRGSVSYF